MLFASRPLRAKPVSEIWKGNSAIADHTLLNL